MVLQNLEFKNAISDPSLFIRKIGKSVTYMLIYVDDMLITSSFKDDVDFVINHLKKIFLTKLL
jgi:hypothetical protein